ncbi:NAD(P)H-hydrate dehydratase [Clostridium intestinale]|uniref:NAD(P)H-hydrate dehydratase n=1 Tax=Clostridium intestinale TaxID=36845 RepID=UPI0028EA07F3|nr:NAD(P)H-hydrate dehydratase [Clostridium intestinale]
MIEILTSKSSREMDKISIDKWGIPSILLMENAVFSLLKHFKDLDDILIICGPGNNGGDGLALTRHLLNLNKRVRVFIAADTSGKTSDFNTNFRLLECLKVEIILLSEDKNLSVFKKSINECKVLVDCIFGTGLNRNIDGIYSRMINEINKSKAYKISIDIPSGLCSDTGVPLGEAIISDKTITFQSIKKGFINYEALDYIGELIVENIGIPNEIEKEVSESIWMLEEKDVKNLIPKRKRYYHKGKFGRVCVVAGSNRYSGAAYLSTQAAVKAGAGLVYLYTDKTLKPSLDSKLTEAMVGDYESEEFKEIIDKSDVVVFGPGLENTIETLDKLKLILETFKGKLLIDADGINVLENNLSLLHKCKCKVVMTPHPGEMSRITGKSIRYVNENRIELVKKFSKEYNIVLLLKGLYTVISDGNGVCVNPTGNSAMASGGMGDTLSGIIGALMGQGVDVFQATKLGAYLHGYIGEKLSKIMYIVNASNIVENLPLFLKEFVSKDE